MPGPRRKLAWGAMTMAFATLGAGVLVGDGGAGLVGCSVGGWVGSLVATVGVGGMVAVGVGVASTFAICTDMGVGVQVGGGAGVDSGVALAPQAMSVAVRISRRKREIGCRIMVGNSRETFGKWRWVPLKQLGCRLPPKIMFESGHLAILQKEMWTEARLSFVGEMSDG